MFQLSSHPIKSLNRLSGGYTSDSNGNSLAFDSILRLDGDHSTEWTSVGKLDCGRGYHGVSVVSSSDIINDCH